MRDVLLEVLWPGAERKLSSIIKQMCAENIRSALSNEINLMSISLLVFFSGDLKKKKIWHTV